MIMVHSHDCCNREKSCWSWPIRWLVIFYTLLPLFGFAFSITWCLSFDFEDSTATHCDVPNFLPSISAVTGGKEPQRTFWRVAAFARLPVAVCVVRLYLRYYSHAIHQKLYLIAVLACMLHLVECVGVLGITIWTCSENRYLHHVLFGVVIVCGVVYMNITHGLLYWGRQLPIQPLELRSLRHKRKCLIVNVLSLSIAAYYFVRHNRHCEPGMYSAFALFEYVFVASNMSYHMTAYYDFYACFINFDGRRGPFISLIWQNDMECSECRPSLHIL